ncbi:acyl-CoA dehydrogenase family protein [Candidatus Poriferisocius sp.]|uniref:acyl-CoA dehydrogenase family protein n=1 Tax=Candidatus Poriferisocius sp. TaxID=3101276 RepID=UPI003B597A7C
MSEDQLRQRVRDLVAEVDPESASQFEFRGAQFDRGLSRVDFPEGKGGLGLSPKAQTVVDEELRKAPRYWHDLHVNPIGIGMGAPTVLAHGTEDMHHRLLRPLFTGEEIWCQMFSEPGAGSDVAGLATRAEADGDEWVVNGQKVWTSLAHRARWGMLVARSDPDAPKHRGLTYFVADMTLPGVEVRPLYQITGEAEFNEVFFNDVRIPDTMRLGQPGQGWNVAITTLMNERVALGGGVPDRGSGLIAVLVSAWVQHRHRDSAAEGPGAAEGAQATAAARRRVLRDRVVKLWTEAEVLRLTNWRARTLASAGTPGPEGSVGKAVSAELNQRIYECLIDVMGSEAMLFPEGYPMCRPEAAEAASHRLTPPIKGFLRSRANTIEGGTAEVMRNILGERVLGLPKEPGVDKNTPWSDIPRN